MAAKTSTATGNWNVGSTWVGGVVPDPVNDTVTVAAAHVVTITANVSQGNSPATVSYDITIQGKLIIADGITFTCKTSIIISSTVATVQIGQTAGGAILEFDATSATAAINYRMYMAAATANIQSISSGTRNVIRSVGTGRNAWLSNGSNTNYGWGAFAYTDFLKMGDSGTLNSFDMSTGSNVTSFTNCTFTSCGKMSFNIGASAPFTLQNTIFSSSQHATNSMTISFAGTPSVARLIDKCSFDKVVDFHTAVTGLSLTGSYFFGGIYANTLASKWTTCDGNFIQSNINATVTWCGDMTNNYFYWTVGNTDPNICQTGSSNLPGTYKAVGNILESNGADNNGAWFYTTTNAAPSALMTLVVTNNIALPNFGAIGGQASMIYVHVTTSANYAVQFDHNTGNIQAGTTGLGLLGASDGINTAAGTYTSVRENLGWAASSGGAKGGLLWAKASTTLPLDIVAPANCGYNMLFNPATTTATISSGTLVSAAGYICDSNPLFSVQPSGSTTDVSGDPQFVDSGRNLAKWYTDTTANGGRNNATTGTAAGDRAASVALIQATPSLTLSSLVPYIRGGFVPKNAAANVTFAGDTNAVTNIGAVQGTFGYIDTYFNSSFADYSGGFA